jgi:hypothetical protein
VRPVVVFLLALLLLPTLAFAWSGKVICIADGDTITVLTEDKQQVRIRLYGIDAPGGGQAYGRKATQYVKRLLADRPVVEIDEHIRRKGMELANTDLKGLVLRDLSLEGDKLSGADLSHADLKSINLSKANLRKVVCRHGTFHKENFPKPISTGGFLEFDGFGSILEASFNIEL